MKDPELAAQLRHRAEACRAQADEFDQLAEKLDPVSSKPTAKPATRRVSNARRQSPAKGRGGPKGMRGRPPKTAASAEPTGGKRAAKRAQKLEKIRHLLAKDPDLLAGHIVKALGGTYESARELLEEAKG